MTQEVGTIRNSKGEYVSLRCFLAVFVVVEFVPRFRFRHVFVMDTDGYIYSYVRCQHVHHVHDEIRLRIVARVRAE
jgi:hypothetical protein